ncbi:hypothetical protein CAPTEDRAFT_159376 [Capitella teleta]|uniref:DUF1279 domain-containing protein n=1 Tax=Capitella teleta TaxID=283909 RepID=R7T6V6_CAPTE|nr:hypothetical protein CAPTEDRAFT_159376 [Capitella teleta]|eukprot:ELT89250.1 hypothetical protein CAPTEDRAFT_159376 [Capitella teleta]
MPLCHILRSGMQPFHSRILIRAVTRSRSSCSCIPSHTQLRTSAIKQTQFLTPTSQNIIPHSPFTSESPQSKPEEKISIFKRFKNAYKEYGKLLIGVHAATSCVWYGSFYYACSTGVDVVAILHYMNVSEVVVRPFESSGLGNFAAAYLLYKLATPARYTVTILGTRYSANLLRRRGYLAPVPPGDNLKSLMKDTRGAVKDRYEDFKDDVQEFKDDVKEKVDDAKDRARERVDDVKDRAREKVVDVKDRATEVRVDVKGKIQKRMKKKM